MKKLQQGFSIVSAIFLLVVLAFLGTAMVTFSTTQHQSVAMDVMGSRAYQAARAGIEWQAFYVVNSASNAAVAIPQCAVGNNLGALVGTLAPFTVTVNCQAASHVEGASTIWIYDVSAVACTEPPCPNPAPGQDYIERVISVKLGR